MTGGNKALLISEVGWRGIKEVSSSLVKSGFLVDIVIKGSVDKEIMGVITKPKGLSIRAVPRNFFKICIFFYLLLHRTINDLKMVVVTKDGTRDWVRAFGFETKVLVETKEGYRLR